MDWERVLVAGRQVALAAAQDAAALVGNAGAGIVGRTKDGDIETVGDQVALDRLFREFAPDRFPYRVRLFNERDGRCTDLAPHAELLVIADEVDGTRAAACGLPCAATSLAFLPAAAEPLMKHVAAGVIATFTRIDWSFVGRDRVWRNGQPWHPMPCSVELSGARLLFETVNSASLSLLGMYLAAFEPNARLGMLSIASSAMASSLICEGSVHGYLHLGRRIWDRWPEFRSYFERHHGPAPGTHGYDIAAAAPLLQACGRTVTDANGMPLDDLRLDDVSQTFSLVAATNPELHGELLRTLDAREAVLHEQIDALRNLF